MEAHSVVTATSFTEVTEMSTLAVIMTRLEPCPQKAEGRRMSTVKTATARLVLSTVAIRSPLWRERTTRSPVPAMARKLGLLVRETSRMAMKTARTFTRGFIRPLPSSFPPRGLPLERTLRKDRMLRLMKASLSLWGTYRSSFRSHSGMGCIAV